MAQGRNIDANIAPFEVVFPSTRIEVTRDLFHADLIALESEKKQDSGASVLQKIVIEAERHKPEAG